jgi:hypothetical protein
MIDNLHRVSADFDLTINAEKSALMMIKNHKKLENLPVRGILVVKSYCYLGVDTDYLKRMTQHM